MTTALPDTCYGLLQESPANFLASPSLTHPANSENSTLYLYTSLLQDSPCSNGTLTAFNFCYRPQCRNETDAGEVEFYALLLLGNAPGYSVELVHRERRSRRFCGERGDIPSFSSCCCRRVRVDSLPLIHLNSSYALAIIIPEDSPGGYLYGMDAPGGTTSSGVILSPSPLDSVPAVGERVEFGVVSFAAVPNRLFQLELESNVMVISCN